MKELFLSSVISAIFIFILVVYLSPYGGQHEPIESLIWIYQNVRWDL